VRDKGGRPYAVRYEQVNAMLLHDFLTQRKRVEEQKATIARLNAAVARQEAMITHQQKGFDEQEAELDALTSALQKLSAQCEPRKFGPLTARRTGSGRHVSQTLANVQSIVGVAAMSDADPKER